MSGVLIYTYLDEMVTQQASDLYMTVGVPPSMRKDNAITPLSEVNLTPDDLMDVLGEVLTSRQRREYETTMELNLALDMGEKGRFRVNVMRQKQYPALVVRRITSNIPTFQDLALPPIFETLAMAKRGLVLVSGVTSSGKSTSLASMVDYRNTNSQGHIITIEDPIEYFHRHKSSIITQREVGIDTASYHIALKNALRQKPDVILIGEIRDAEVMDQALSAAETGHLCLATIHTNNTSQAVERIINFFPEERQKQVRISLSMNLRAIVGQRLINNTQCGVSLALEVLINEALIKDLILKGETGKIREVMSKNNPADMVLFDQSLLKLYIKGLITAETAIAEADISADMRMRIQQLNVADKSSSTGRIDTSNLSL